MGVLRYGVGPLVWLVHLPRCLRAAWCEFTGGHVFEVAGHAGPAYLWPGHDKEAFRVVFDELRDLDAVIEYCQRVGCDRIAVQASGLTGLRPLRLAKVFKSVYTFEPDPENFVSLVVNCREWFNVFASRAALSDQASFGIMSRSGGNAGAHSVEVLNAGDTPMVTIDGMRLPGCDLIALDVEGREHAALLGAIGTIQQYEPVILFKDRGLGKKYGVPKGATEKMLTSMGYEVVTRFEHDVLMAHAPAEVGAEEEE